MTELFKGTTICAVKRNGITAIGGDGQVTMGESVIFKGNAVKVKRIYDGKVVVGFAGSVSDAFALSEKFEEMLQKFSGNLTRAAVELASDRTRIGSMRHRFGRKLCAQRSQSVVGKHRSFCRGNSQKSHENSRGSMCFHQP